MDFATLFPWLATSLNVTPGALGNWTQAELYQYAEEALHDVGRRYVLIAEIDATTDLVANQALYEVPSEHIVTILAAADGVVLTPAGVAEMEALDDDYEEAPGAAAPTRWIGNNLGLGFIRVYPPKNAGGVLTLVYQKHPPDLTPTAPAGGDLASVSYSYPNTSNPSAVHSLTIAGTVYSIEEGTLTAGQLAGAIAGLASADPNCSVSFSATNYTVTIAPLVAGASPIAVSGSDSNPSVNLATGGSAVNMPAPIGDYLAVQALEQARMRQGDGQMLDASQAFGMLGALYEKCFESYWGAGE